MVSLLNTQSVRLKVTPDGQTLRMKVLPQWPSSVLPGTGITITLLGGDYAIALDATGIPINSITNLMLADIPTNSLIGRDTAGTGDPENITLNATLEMDGALALQRAALIGDVTAPAGSNTTTIASNAVTTVKINDTAVTFAKIQDIATNTLIGRDTAGTGVPESITLNSTLEMDGALALQRAALIGDVTAPAGSNTTTIASNAVTTTKIINDAVTTAKINNNAVTFAKIQAMTTARLLGASNGTAAEEITVGTGLTLSAGSLTGDVISVATKTGAVTLDDADIGAAASATEYTPTSSTVDGHLAGIDTALGGVGGGFPAGTLMLFQQTAAPSGWTKETTHNDKAFRVVSGTAGSGGSVAFSTVFGKTATDAHTLTTAQLAVHSHVSDGRSEGIQGAGENTRLYMSSGGTNDYSTLNAGSGSSHTHNMDIQVQYVDLIIASKD